MFTWSAGLDVVIYIRPAKVGKGRQSTATVAKGRKRLAPVADRVPTSGWQPSNLVGAPFVTHIEELADTE